MGKQLEIFPAPPPTADEELNAAQAEMRLSRMARDAVDAPSRDQRRSRRHRAVRALTVSTKRISKRELELGRALYPEDEHADVARPQTRGECKGGQRPCPFVSCSHHLYLDVSARSGAIKLNFPDLEVHELAESCALDVADRLGTTLEDTGRAMNLTRERVRQIEVRALAKCHAAIETRRFRDLVDEGPGRKRRLPVLEQRQDDDQDDDEPGEYEGAEPPIAFDAAHFASDELDAE